MLASTVVRIPNYELGNGRQVNLVKFVFGLQQLPEEKEHFSTYAFDSKTGAARWKHEPGDYETDRISREVLISTNLSAGLNLLSKLSRNLLQS